LQTVKVLICIVGLLLNISSDAKNKHDGELLSKKDEIAEKLESQISTTDALFERNNGQFEADFQYRFSSKSACVDFYRDKVLFSLRKVKRDFNPQKVDEPMLFEYVSWHIELSNTNLVTIESVCHTIQSNVNYFSKNGKNIKKVSSSSIKYEGIYPNIDLVFYKSENDELKYDFILHPGARLSDIALTYNGVENLEIDDLGNLVYSTPWGSIKEEVPYSYKQNSKQEVDIQYSLSENKLEFSAEFDLVTEEIILDPIYVDWSSYFYGTGNNGTTWAYTWVYDLDMDSDDNVYLAGITNDKFPGLVNSYDTSTNGYYDAFVCKMSPRGDSIVWISYLGGSSYEYCFTLAVNNNQEPVVSGFTWSTDFPITKGAFDSTSNITNGSINYYAGYVTKFSKDGDSLLFSTYLSGNGSDLIQSMVLDESDNIYLTGQTNSTDFQVTTGAYQTTYAGGSGSGGWYNSGDAFLTKMKPDGSGLVFSTYFGGIYDDVAYEVAISPNKDIYIVGKTNSTNFPTTPGSSIFNYNVVGTTDGFIAKFNPSGSSLQYSKMMGGSGEDWFEGVYVNERDEAYVAGISRSSDFFTSSNAYQKNSGGGADAVVVKFNPGGQNVYYSTYLGGSGDELYYSGFIYNSNVRIAANVREEPIICGITRSNNFPITPDAIRTTNPGAIGSGWWNTSATLTKLNYFGDKLLYGTYYGGSSYEVPGANKLKRISCYTNILYGGFTASSDYPTTAGVYKENKNTASTGFFWTGFISKFRDTLYTDDIEFSLEDTLIKCDKVFDILDVKNVGADVLWSTGNTQQYQIVEDTGMVWVQATYGCDTVRDSIHFVLEYSPKIPVLPADSTYCDTYNPIVLDAKNDTVLATYKWSTNDVSDTIIANVPTDYWVDIITPHCGTKRDNLSFNFLKKPDPFFPEDSTFCNAVDMVLQVGDSIVNEESYAWSTGDSSSYISIDSVGVYQVVVSNECGVDSAAIIIELLHTPEIDLPLDSEFCDDINLEIQYGDVDNEESYGFANSTNGKGFNTTEVTHTFTEVGIHELTISNKCATVSDTIVLSLLKSPSANLGRDSTFCDNISHSILIGLSDNKEKYRWENGGEINSRTITSSGEYWVEISNKCGRAYDTVNYFLVQSPSVQLPKDSVFCDVVDLNLDVDLAEMCNYLWNNGSTDSSLSITNPGFYKVTISNYCGAITDSVTIGLIASPEVNLGEDEIFCDYIDPKTYSVGKGNNEEQYLWSDGNIASTNTLSSETTHWVRISNKCATVSDSITYSVNPNPVVYLGPDTTLCGNFNLTLNAGHPGMKYNWEPYGETTRTIQAREQITYRVTVFNENGCEGSDDFMVRPDCISKSFVPSAFSPNGDGLNDVFKPTLINYEQYSIAVYNRWGEKVYESNITNAGWDGVFKGDQVPNGVYTYHIRFITTETGSWQNLNGLVNVVR